MSKDNPTAPLTQFLGEGRAVIITSMNKFIILLGGLFFILLSLSINLLAKHFYLYWQSGWIDSLAHLSGSIGVTLLFFFFYPRGDLFLSLFFILLVGIAWEVYEYQAGLVFYSSSYLSDTLSDLFFDLLGGFLVYYSVNFLVKKWPKELKS